MTVQSIAYALQNASHSAALFRQATSAPFQTPGILGVGELAVSQQGTPNMSVILGPGRGKVAGTQVTPPAGLSFTTQAMYDVLNDANVTLTVTTSNPSNPRIDAVYVGVQDSFYSGASNTALAGIVAGTPGATPVAPAVPANSLLVAYIAVGANVTSIVAANITLQSSLARLIPNTATVVRRSTTPVSGGASVWQLLSTASWWTQDLNIGFAAFNGTIVAPVTGWYRLGAGITFNPAPTGLILMVTKNNSSATETGNILRFSTNAAAGELGVYTSKIVKLTAGDVLRFQIFPTSTWTWSTDPDDGVFSLELLAY